MKSILAVILALGVAACSEPPPPPAAKKADPAPVPAPQAKAPEAPKPVAPPVEEPRPEPNKELAQKVKRALEQDAKIQAAAIDVTASNGTVTLWGTAATAGERNRAAAAAAKVQGVTKVENKIAIVKGS